MTVAPRAAACGASSREASAPAENRAMSTPSNASRDGLADLVGLAVDRDGPAGRSPGGEQPQLPDGELALVQDLDHRPPDDAGGADDRDGEGVGWHSGMAPQTFRYWQGTAGV